MVISVKTSAPLRRTGGRDRLHAFFNEITSHRGEIKSPIDALSRAFEKLPSGSPYSTSEASLRTAMPKPKSEALGARSLDRFFADEYLTRATYPTTSTMPLSTTSTRPLESKEDNVNVAPLRKAITDIISMKKDLAADTEKEELAEIEKDALADARQASGKWATW